MIKSISPCSGWYYVAEHEGSHIVFNVAAWALLETGEVIGMVAPSGAATAENVARLSFPPPIKGSYVSEEVLSQQQRSAAQRG
jgi:hypothetical protein